MRDAFRFFVPALFAASSLVAQLGPGLGGIGAGGPGPIGAGPIGAGPNGAGPNSSMPTQTIPGGIPGQFPDSGGGVVFLSGRVAMEDGTPPAASVEIRRDCSGTARTVAWTNPKGQFSFRWDDIPGVFPDAGAGPDNAIPGAGPGLHGGATGDPALSRNMLGCVITVSAAGFRSDRVDLSSRRNPDSSDLGTIVLHRVDGVAGTFVSATALSAPKNARKAWEKGADLLHRSKSAEAEKELEKAVAIDPQYANAWLDLGRARTQRQEDGPARDAFLKAIEADGKLVDPYVLLGETALDRMMWPEAARYLDRALDLDPVDYPRLWLEDAVADYNVQNFARAEKNARDALRLQGFDPQIERLLGQILMDKHEDAGALQAFRAYLKLSPGAKDAADVKSRIDEIENRAGAAK